MRSAAVPSVLLFLAVSSVASASGFLMPRSGEPPIRVQSHRVKAVMEDGIARTTVRQTFLNPYDRELEAIYVFPLPEGAALVEVAMEVGGQRLEGLLAERQKARRVYDRIVRQRRDPALVEQIGRHTFRLSVYPVMPKKPTVVEFTYLEHVPLERGAFRYRYPLALEGRAAKTREDFTFLLTVKSSVPLGEVTADEADLQIVSRAPGVCVASLERRAAKLDKDIQVTARLAADRPALSVKTFRGEGDNRDGWFLLLVTPPPVSDRNRVPRDMILVLDTSGSMEGEKIEKARASALHLLEGLHPTDRVNVLLFSSSVQAFADEPVAATPENLAKLRAFVTGIVAEGATNLAGALEQAFLRHKFSDRVCTVVLLTDGRPTVGEERPEVIVKMAREGGRSGLRVYPFGVGNDVDSGLLDGVAEATRGQAEVFRSGQEIRSRIGRFLDRTSSPVFSGLRVLVPGARDIFPRPFPDVYAGEQLAIVGRYQGGGSREVSMTATSGQDRVTCTTVVDFPAAPGGSPAVRDLFARRKLDYLERQRRLRSGLTDEAYFAALDRGAYSTQDEIVGEIIAVSLEHGIQSAFTSFIALLPEDRHRIDPRDALALQQAMERAHKARNRVGSGVKTAAAETPDSTGKRSGRFGDPLDVPEVGDPIEEPEVEEMLEEGESEDDSTAEQPYEGEQSHVALGLGGGATHGKDGFLDGRRGAPRGLRRRYGGQGTADAVDLSLDWLARHQVPEEGYWDANGFGEQCKQNTCKGPGHRVSNPRVTALSLHAFLGAGYTHQAGKYKKRVGDAVKYLKRIQDPEGCFGPRTGRYLLTHVCCLLAMAEAYGMSNSPLLRRPVEKGLTFLEKAFGPEPSGPDRPTWWSPARPSDHNVLLVAWSIMAMKSIRASGLKVDPEAFTAARTWLDRVTDPATGHVGVSRTGGNPARAANAESAPLAVSPEALTAMAMLTRIFCGEDPETSSRIQLQADCCLARLPAWNGDGSIDHTYWYFGTLAMFQVGGAKWWAPWNRAMKKAIVEHQRKKGCERGSWNPEGPWGRDGGRVYTTALMTLCLEIYYRYGKVFGTK